jgi:hypothetical protein
MLAVALLVLMQVEAPVDVPQGQAPGLPSDEAPVVENAPVVESAPVVDECLALLREGKRVDAQACYAARAQGDDDNARIARELADLVATLELRPPTLADPATTTTPGFDVEGLVYSGKLELIATSTIVGGYMATVAATGGLTLLCDGSFGCGGPLAGLVLLAPVVGGGLGLGVSTATLLAVDNLSPGDVNAVRAVMLLGTFDSILVPIAVLPSSTGGTFTALGVTFGMFAVQAVGVGAGIGVAAVLDLPEGAGSLALSTGLWTSVIGVLGANMFGLLRNPTPQGTSLLLFSTANLGFIGGMAVSPYLPISRAETWAIDVGGAVGLLAGASLAFQPKFAGNPFVGWGTMAVGTGVGMGAGFAAARYLPPLVAGLPEIVAFSPIIIDDADPARAMRGAMVMGRF